MVGRPGMRRTARRTSRRTSRRVSRRQNEMYSDPEPAQQESPEPVPAPEPVAAAPAPAAPVEEDKYAKLKEAKELLDAGVLTEEEFAAEKAKILG